MLASIIMLLPLPEPVPGEELNPHAATSPSAGSAIHDLMWGTLHRGSRRSNIFAA